MCVGRRRDNFCLMVYIKLPLGYQGGYLKQLLLFPTHHVLWQCHSLRGVSSSHGTSVCAVWRLTLCPLLSQHNIIGTQEAKVEESLVLNPNSYPKYVTRSGAVNSILSRVWRAPSYNSD